MPGCHLTRPQFTKAAERIYFYGDDDDDDNYVDVDDDVDDDGDNNADEYDAWLSFNQLPFEAIIYKSCKKS